MPVILRTEKSSNNLSVVLEDLGELCYGINIPGFHENSAPLWSSGQDAWGREIEPPHMQLFEVVSQPLQNILN